MSSQNLKISTENTAEKAESKAPNDTLTSFANLISLGTTDRKEQKKVDKLSAQIPYHEGRGGTEEVTKIKGRIEAIWAKAKEAQYAM